MISQEGTYSQKTNIIKFVLNNLHGNALMIHWRRQNTSSDSEWQAEAPLNGGNLNPTYVEQLDQWVTLSKQYGFYIIFDEWFSPMLAQQSGQWTGFNDTVFQQHWQNFYHAFARHFAGNTTIAGFLCCEDVVQNDTYPYSDSGSVSFNSLWNSKMTNLSLAVHQADSSLNFIAEVTLDWDGGGYTLGSRALYANAWQPLKDTNPHVLYRTQWNPHSNVTQNSSNPYYPYDGGLANGGANWINETGLPFTMAVELRAGDWVWDSAAFTWETNVLSKLTANGIGVDFCTYDNRDSTDPNPNALFDQYGNELQWGIVYANWAASITTTNTIQSYFYELIVGGMVLVLVPLVLAFALHKRSKPGSSENENLVEAL